MAASAANTVIKPPIPIAKRGLMVCATQPISGEPKGVPPRKIIM